MATPEGKVKDKIKAGLSDVKQTFGPGLKWDMTVSCGMGTNGVPDFRGLLRGAAWSIEAKAAGGVMSKLQEQWRNEFVAAGGFYFLVEPKSQNKPDLDEVRAAVNIALTWFGNNPVRFHGTFLTMDTLRECMEQ